MKVVNVVKGNSPDKLAVKLTRLLNSYPDITLHGSPHMVSIAEETFYVQYVISDREIKI